MRLSDKTPARRALVHSLMAAVSVLALLGPTTTRAQAPAAGPAAQTANLDLTSATMAVDTVMTLHLDKSAEVVETRRIKILGAAAIEAEGQQSIQYIEGMQTLEIEAYTEKPDGSRI